MEYNKLDVIVIEEWQKWIWSWKEGDPKFEHAFSRHPGAYVNCCIYSEAMVEDLKKKEIRYRLVNGVDLFYRGH